MKKFTIKPNCGILNEFYTQDGHIKKGLSFKEYKNKVLYRVKKVLENRGILYTNNEDGLLKHMLIEIIIKKLKKLKIKTFDNVKNNFKAWMKIKAFKELFYVVITLIFSCEFSEISDMLSIKCCTSDKHFGFCKEKWEEL